MTQSTKYQFHVNDALAAAIAVDEFQGFINSNSDSIWVRESDTMLHPNKVVVQDLLTSNASSPYTNLTVTSAHYDQAKTIKSLYEELLIEKKVTGSIIGFDAVVARLIKSDYTDEFGISVISSLPNGVRVQKVRDHVSSLIFRLRNDSEFIGVEKRRERLLVDIVDVKPIKNIRMIMVLGVVDGKHIVKLWWPLIPQNIFNYGTQPDISSVFVGKTWEVDATVASHTYDDKTACNITELSHVKFNFSV